MHTHTPFSRLYMPTTVVSFEVGGVLVLLMPLQHNDAGAPA